MKEILERVPDNFLLAMIVCALALLVVGLWVAIRQGRELSIWPPKLGPVPVSMNSVTNPVVIKNNIEKITEPLEIVSYSTVNWELLLEEAKHTFRASGFALVKIVELNSRRLLRKIENSGSFSAEIYLGDPFSPAAAMRVKDESDNYVAPQIISGVSIQIKDIQEILKKNGKESKLILKHFPCYPTMAVVIVDNDLYVYFYPFGKLGTDSPVMIFRDYNEHKLADFFVEHFDTLASNSYEIPKEKLQYLICVPEQLHEDIA